MPQMSPMPWVILFIMILSVLSLMSSIIYFYISVKSDMQVTLKKKLFSISW